MISVIVLNVIVLNVVAPKMELKKVFFLIVDSPDANWGSSTQSQAFLTALKGVHNLTKVDEHIKNYRPKVTG
jgi:hypothetical protein